MSLDAEALALGVALFGAWLILMLWLERKSRPNETDDSAGDDDQ